MQSDEQNFFPHLIDNEENSFVTLWPSQTSLTASYSCVFWKYALSTVQKVLWASKKECFLWKSLELYNEKSVTCAITTVILIFLYCSSLVAIWPQCHALYEKPLFERWFICVCVFFSFFSQIEFFNQNDDVLPFSQFPPERFLYLNVGLISLDVWLVDKILFLIFLSCASTFS